MPVSLPALLWASTQKNNNVLKCIAPTQLKLFCAQQLSVTRQQNRYAKLSAYKVTPLKKATVSAMHLALRQERHWGEGELFYRGGGGACT